MPTADKDALTRRAELAPCWSYYDTRRIASHPDTPLDRWCQAKDTRDVEELIENLTPLVRDHHVTTLIEPFTGLGSAGLAARHLGIAYLGAERSRSRTLQARSKTFLTLPLLDALTGDAGGAGELLPPASVRSSIAWRRS